MYYFEIQLDFAPACGWLRSPFGRKDWETAFDEGKAYLFNAETYRNHMCLGLRVVFVEKAA
jgi:hypothetical protein